MSSTDSEPPPSSSADRKLLEMLDRAFAHHAGSDAVIDAKELQRALGLKSEYLAGRVLACLDRDGNGVITRDEFLSGVRTLVFGGEREKLAFAFRLHDHNGDGFIDRDELYRMICISLAESEIRERPTQPPDVLTRAVFSRADLDGDGRISFDELVGAVRRRPALLASMTRSEATWIAPDEDLLSWLDERNARRSRRGPGARDTGHAPIVVVALWVFAQAAVFAFAFLRAPANPRPPFSLLLATAFARCIELDGALILVPMMRRLITRLRASFLGRAIPVDEAIEFHKLLGHTMFALAGAHAAAAVATYVEGHSRSPVSALLATGRGATGGLLLLVFAVMWFCSLAFIRRSRHFELFYFTHLLYVAWLALAIAHAPVFGAWAGAAIVGYAVEHFLRRRTRKPDVRVLSSVALRSGVTTLELARPPGFTFQPGDYVFLRLPAIAKREWHPFTISSAPERPNLVVHVRALGNWSSALRERVETNPRSLVTANVDGPYGSPTGHLFTSRFAVLIGAGIGVTPFASVLESFVMRKAAVARGEQPSGTTPEKVHFFWVNRDQYSFEWFAALLYHLERTDKEGLLDVHLCMTGGRAGATALGLELAREIMHTSGRTDIITGLRTHTHVGSLEWETELRTIRDRHAPNAVEVFFCGPPGLAKRIREICHRLGLPFREERF